MKNTRMIIVLIATLLLGIGASISPAEQSAEADQVPTEINGNENSTPPTPISDVVKPDDVKAAATGKPASRRHFFDLFYGSVQTADTDATGSTQNCDFLFGCSPPKTFGQHAQFGTSSAYGVRIGRWLEDYPSIGLAMEISYLSADAPNVSVWYVPISFVVLARYALLPADAVPEGRLQLYGGLMLSFVTGNVQVNGVGGSSDGSIGNGALLGIAWHFPSFAVFGEYRMTQASLSYDNSGDITGFGGTQTASVDLNSRQAVFGMSFKY
jgi:hypothetical protein